MYKAFVVICLTFVFLFSSSALGSSSHSTSNATSTDIQLDFYLASRDLLYPVAEKIYSVAAFSANNGLSKKQTYAEIMTLFALGSRNEYSSEQLLISVLSYYQEFSKISSFMGYSSEKDVDSVVTKIALLAKGYTKETATNMIKGSIKCSDYLAAFLYDAMMEFYYVSEDFKMFCLVVDM